MKPKPKEAKKAMEPNKNQIELVMRNNAVERLPDSDRYKFRFKIRSASSDSLYLVSWDNAPGAHYWKCSCRGCIRWGLCKHLKAMGLQGRSRQKTIPVKQNKALGGR